jgi:hypothetical protein
VAGSSECRYKPSGFILVTSVEDGASSLKRLCPFAKRHYVTFLETSDLETCRDSLKSNFLLPRYSPSTVTAVRGQVACGDVLSITSTDLK